MLLSSVKCKYRHTHTCAYVCMYVHTYIFRLNERERETESLPWCWQEVRWRWRREQKEERSMRHNKGLWSELEHPWRSQRGRVGEGKPEVEGKRKVPWPWQNLGIDEGRGSMHQVIRKENVGSASNLAMTSQAPPPPPSLTFSLHVIAESISVQRIWCSRRQTDRQIDRDLSKCVASPWKGFELWFN